MQGLAPTRTLVTGSAGHLGEALVRTLRDAGMEVLGVDRVASDFTAAVGLITDRVFIAEQMRGIDVVMHTATLHKPHVATHSMQDFVDTNVSGTLVLLEAAMQAGVSAFVYTSTTSTFGGALRPTHGQPAAWITEAVQPQPKNIYGATKTCAEDLCELFYKLHALPCIVLRTSRFFPEGDDDAGTRTSFDDANLKTNELTHRRVDLHDAVVAHQLAARRAADIGFARYIISATSPFMREDLLELRANAPAVLARRVPEYVEIYQQLGWRMLADIGRVYVNDAARENLGWQPKFDFAHVLARLSAGKDPRSALARAVGSKGYHDTSITRGRYPFV